MGAYALVVLMAGVGLLVHGSPPAQRRLPVQFASGHHVAKRASGCYGDLGCYDSRDFYNTVYRPIDDLPESRNVVNTQFKLFTRSNLDEISAQKLVVDDTGSLENSDFRSERLTKFIVHGYSASSKSHWVKKLKDAFLIHGDYNIVYVDWENGADGGYSQAATNAWLVGGEIALLIKALQRNLKANLSSFHLVGHSLGAHVSGYAGARLPGLARITGLDPADPFFQNTSPLVCLDPTDAQFVDVIHTDGNHVLEVIALKGGFGMKEPAGHMDFYPNGGEEQPGCDKHFLHKVWTTITGDLTYTDCDHSRAIDLFVDSINSDCEMVAFPCKDYQDFKDGKCLDCGTVGCGSMGLKADERRPPPGTVNVKYYLETAAAAPFCEHHLLVTVTLSGDRGSARGRIKVTLLNDNGVQFATSLGPKYLEAGTAVKSDVLTVTNSWDHVTEVHVQYVCERPTWRLFYCWHYRAVKLNSVEIYHFESRIRTWFCGSGADLKDGSLPRSITASTSC